MSKTMHDILLVLVMAAVTACIRFAPFVVFRKKTPEAVKYLGRVLPFAVMGMLLVYCLKDVTLLSWPHGLPEAICIALTALLHKWKHSMFISMGVGTVAYMLLVQLVF